jgi:hypothetical protein
MSVLQTDLVLAASEKDKSYTERHPAQERLTMKMKAL